MTENSRYNISNLINFIKKNEKDDIIKKEIDGLSIQKLNIAFKKQNVLSIAIEKSNLEITEYLLIKGVNVNGITPEGLPMDTPIIFTKNIKCFETFCKMIILLLEYGADLNSVGILNKTLLYYMCSQKKPEAKFINFIKSKGAIKGSFEFPIDFVQNLDLVNKAKLKGIITEGKSEKELEESVMLYDSIIHEKIKTKKYQGDLCGYIKLVREKERQKRAIKENYKINEFTMTGDSIHFFSDEVLYLSIEGNFGWYFHMSEIPSILYYRKNPYTFEKYSKERLKDMAEKLQYIEYLSPEDIFVHVPQKVCNFSNYTDFLNYLISFMDPYLNIKDIEKIRIYLINDLVIFFGLPRFITSRNNNLTTFLENVSMNLVIMLRKNMIELFVIIQMFSQVIEDNILYDNVLELFNLTSANRDEIFEVFSLSIIEIGIIYGEDVVKKFQEILAKQKISMRDIFLNILKTL